MFKWLKSISPGSQEKPDTSRSMADGAGSKRNIITPSNSDLISSGNAFLSQGKLDEAAACYQQAIDASATDVGATINLAFILIQQHKLQEAERYLNAAVAVDPRSIDGFYMLGTVNRQNGNLPDAIEYFATTIEISENFEAGYLDLCQVLLQDGQTARAKSILIKALELFANSVNINYLLANIFIHEKSPILAIPHLQKIVSIELDHEDAHKSLAFSLQTVGRLDEAIEHYDRVLKLNSQNHEALHGLGTAFHARGKFSEAEAIYRKVIFSQPQNAQAHNNLGCVWREQGEIDNAIESFRMALSLSPNFPEAHHNLALAFRAQGDLESAVASHRNALLIRPDYAEAHHQLGVTLQGQGNREAAIACYRQALSIQPNLSDTHNHLGLALRESGYFEDAVASHQKAIALDPAQAQSYNFLGIAFQEHGEFDDAIASYRRALGIDPDYPEAHCNLAGVLELSCELDAAIAHYHRALDLKPDLMQAHCALLYTLSLTGGRSSEEYLAEARRFGTKVTSGADPYSSWISDDVSEGDRPLNIGLVSGDLREHPVGFFLEGILRHLNPDRVSLTAFSSGTKVDALTARIKPYFAKWEVITGLDDGSAAQLIHNNGIDILIDLAGHTAHNRLSLFAWKAAPVQASWLGYWASTGVPGMDYLLVDPISAPDNHASLFTEHLWHLPETRLCFTPPTTDAPIADTPAIRNGYVTFGCYQNTNKINDDVLAVWAQIFSRMPNARLRVQSKQMAQASARKTLQQKLTRIGIAEDRVSLVGPMLRHDYLASHADVDIILDTFPFPGGTTTCEALWMGVPTLTLISSDSLISRQGASLLTCAGQSNWVAHDVTDYVGKAINFAGDIDALNRLRANLREQVRVSPLFDAARFARHFEEALHGMRRQKQVAFASQY